MKRVVNTNLDKINIVFPRPATLAEHPAAVKPRSNGILWYGIDESWIDWARQEMPDRIQDKNFEIDLDEARILKIDTMEDAEKFYKGYCLPGEWPYYMAVDWKKIFLDYAGMEIGQKFLDECLKNFEDNRHSWRFPWSVAGGCVWDSTALIGFKKYDLSAGNPSKDTEANNNTQLNKPPRYEP